MKKKRMAMGLGLGLFIANGVFALSYTNNLIAHFDGTSMNLTNGNKVARWLNQTGNGDAWTVTSEARPLAVQLQNAGGDTYTVLDFDGVGNHLTMSGDTNNYDGNTFTWIIAYKNGDTNQNGKALLASTYDYTYTDGATTNTAGNNPVWQTFANSGNTMWASTRSSSGGFIGKGTVPSDNGWHVISGKWAGPGSRFYAYLDKVYLGYKNSANANPFGHRRTRIGSASSGTAGQFFKGQIAEVLIYKETVEDPERLAIEDELLAKYSTLSDLTPYERWAKDYNLPGGESAMTDNPDGDLANNLAEYALGGDPTNSADVGNLPYSEVVQDGGSNWFQFVYYMRNDAAVRGLSYTPQVSFDLVAGGWSTNGISTIGVGTFDSAFDSVTSRVSTASEEEQFMNLLMEFQN